MKVHLLRVFDLLSGKRVPEVVLLNTAPSVEFEVLRDLEILLLPVEGSDEAFVVLIGSDDHEVERSHPALKEQLENCGGNFQNLRNQKY